MKRIFQSKGFLRKIAIVVLVVLLCYCIIPTYTYADFGGDILKVFTQLLAAFGDVVIGALNHFMLGTNRIIGSVMLSQDSETITNERGALYAGDEEPDIILGIDHDEFGNVDDDNEEAIDGGLWGDDDEWEVPNILYSPEAIFSNRIAALDVNFLSPNTYDSVQNTDSAQEASESAAQFLQSTIANWYVGFRNIAAVALLVVLVFIGIKITLGSISDKAKYKERLRDWVMALCLVFIIHFIMSGILMLSQTVTNLFASNANDIVVEVRPVRNDANSEANVKFSESLIGVARLRVQSSNPGTSAVFCLIYLILVVYTVMFTFTYLKRLLYMAFLTMIAPLVAITYPIDKAGDGQAQAFNMWFKEYTMNAIIQPMHLILYTALISSAHELVVKNWIYAIVAITFLIPAEKFVKKMFGFNKAETPGTLGGFAAGAVTMGAMSKLSKSNIPALFGGNKSGGEGKSKVRTVDNSTGNDSYLSDNPRFNGIQDVSGSTLISNQNVNNNGELSPMNKRLSPEEEQRLNYQYQNNGINGEGSANLTDGMTTDKITTRGIGALGNGFNVDEGNISQSGFGATQDFVPAKGDVANGIGNRTSNSNSRLLRTETPTTSQSKNQYAGNWGGIKRVAIKGAKTLGKGAWKNKKSIIKGVAKGLVVPAAAAVGTGIGLAAGLASGDPSKIAQYAAMGLVSGKAIGSNAVDLVGNVVEGMVQIGQGAVSRGESIRNTFEEGKYGLAEAESMRQQRDYEANKKKFMKDEDQISQAEKMQAKLAQKGYDANIKDIMKSRYDYVSAGVENKQIENAQMLEANSGINGSTHEDYVRVAVQAKKYGVDRNTFNDEKKYNGIRDNLITKMGSEKDANDAMGIMAQIYGEKSGHETQMNKIRAEKAKKEQPEKVKSEAIRKEILSKDLPKSNVDSTRRKTELPKDKFNFNNKN